MIKAVGVHIKVANFQKSLAFYNALGFKKVFTYGPDCDVKEDYSGAIFDTANGKIEIADGHRAVKQEVFVSKVSNSKLSLMINVPSLYSLTKLAKKANIAVSVPPRHYYWGSLELIIKDPDGAVLVFIAPYSKSEAKKIHASEEFAVSPSTGIST